MNVKLKAGFATAALAVAALAPPSIAADLGGPYGKRGSIKDDGYSEPVDYRAAPRGPAGPCYFRGDVGYSASRNPSASWPVSTFDRTYNGTSVATSTSYSDGNYSYVGDEVHSTSLENAFFGGVGLGCGMGSRGIRGEVMLGYTGNRKFDGVPHDFYYNQIFTAPSPTTQVPVNDPIHTSIRSTTAMFNAYKDLGNWGGITPYVGAGVGVSYNKMDEVYFTQNAFLTNRIQGNSNMSMAWSLMAGIGWQVSDRAILDFGYRYMDYGKAVSGRVDSAGFVNPALRIEDLTAHEFKVGLRYHFGSDCCASPYAPAPMK